MFQQALAQCDDDTQKLPEGDAQIERQLAAQLVARWPSGFGAYLRCIRARLGPAQATVATAHKIAARRIPC
jgi:hypothetical protein